MQNSVSISAPKWKRALFSSLILEGNATRKITYTSVMVGLCAIANCFFSFSFMDVQFSLTTFVSMLAGAILGPVLGFASALLGDFIGYVYNSWGMIYMPWVGLSSAVFALLSGLTFTLFKSDKKWTLYVKIVLLCVVSFLVCSVGINTVGLYLYYDAVGISSAFNSYASANFGGNTGFIAYLVFRFIFKGQILVSMVNYSLLVVSVPILSAVKPLKISLS